MKAHWRKCPRKTVGGIALYRIVAWGLSGSGVKEHHTRNGDPCPTCDGHGKIRVRPRKKKETSLAPRKSKFERHMNIHVGKRRVSLATMMRKIG